jgi:hypothetical protein
MSQKFEERVIPQRTEQRLVEMACDICHNKADRPYTNQWEAMNSYKVSRTVVTFEEGEAYPEGRNTKTLTYDICPTCFMQHLVPFMTSHGAKPRTDGEE